MMKFSMKCPACGAVMTVDAVNKDEANHKLMAMGKQHGMEHHKDMPPMDEEAGRKMVEEGMVEGEMKEETGHSDI